MNLHEASRMGDKRLVNSLLMTGVDVGILTKNKEAALDLATSANHVAVMALLIDSGADVNRWNTLWNYTPLSTAVTCRHDAETVASECRVDAVRLLLSHGADVNHKVDGWAPLLRAAFSGCSAIVGLLLEHGASLCQTSFVVACKEGYHAVAEILLKYGIEAKTLSKYDRDAAWLAVLSHSRPSDWLSVVEQMTKNGFNVNQFLNTSGTPLKVACANKNASSAIVKVLLEHCTVTFINQGDPVYMMTPLHEAAIRGCVAMVKILLNSGADIESKTRLHQTPLWFAVRKRNIDVAILLINNGADFSASAFLSGKSVRTEGRKTPLRVAVENQDYNMCSLLVNAGLDLKYETWLTSAPFAGNLLAEKLMHVVSNPSSLLRLARLSIRQKIAKQLVELEQLVPRMAIPNIIKTIILLQDHKTK